MDLSHPLGDSINEHISGDEYSVQYTHFVTATEMVRMAGKAGLMSKVDIKHAFRILPVKESNWPLLAYHWEGFYFVDTRLPFGLRSSPAIFNNFADLVCWVINHIYKLKRVIHYADDYLLVSLQDLLVARQEVERLNNSFRDLGIPLANEKMVGPASSITYLGIQINSNDLIISIPDDKLRELRTLLPWWCNRRTCTKQQLLSLIGKLSFACKVVRPGRIFLRRMIDLSTTVSKLHHHITLNKQAQADIHWWCEFLPFWNNRSIIPETFKITSSDIRLFTDASKKGFGAIYGDKWIQSEWDEKTKTQSIDFQELFAIVAAAYTWGKKWVGKRIVFITDNLPITQIWQTHSSQVPNIMMLIRKLFLCAVMHDFTVSFKHILGIHNPIADYISRFQETRFRLLKPDAEANPTPIPTAVWSVENHQHIPYDHITIITRCVFSNNNQSSIHNSSEEIPRILQ